MNSGLPFTSITRQQDRKWIFRWDTTTATYYRIVLFGREIDRATTNMWVCREIGYESFPPPIEVMEENNLAQSELFIPFITIQWYGKIAAEGYIVEEYNGSSWVQRKLIQENDSTVYSITTPILEDTKTYTYGVQAIKDGLKSSIQEFKVTMICNPIDDKTKVGYNNATQEITIAGE